MTDKSRLPDDSLEKATHSLDELDIELARLMVNGHSNSQIADELGRPLSTIQRRTRNLLKAGFISFHCQLNYDKLGLKSGLLHIYLSDGDPKSTIDHIFKLRGITSADLHIGNSDIVAGYVCGGSLELYELIDKIKKVTGVTRVIWSEKLFGMSNHNGIDLKGLIRRS